MSDPAAFEMEIMGLQIISREYYAPLSHDRDHERRIFLLLQYIALSSWGRSSSADHRPEGK
jgi:hypothetical protein